MKVLVSGASGFIGSASVAYLQDRGHSVVRLVRNRTAQESATVLWAPSAGQIGPLPEGIDAVVHLAGESILGRWTKRKKERIYASRILSTQLLARQLASLNNKPKVFICASAVGYYGSRCDTVLSEKCECGQSFLSQVCRDWEAASEPARSAGIRVVNLRLGMVLSKQGGALAKMLPAFKLGLGGVIGDGRQWVSWISLADAVRIIEFALTEDTLCGPVNAVAPEPVDNRTFTKTLSSVLNRPAVLRIPSMLLKLSLGQCADETLLASTKAIPEKLLNTGYSFTHCTLASAMSDISA
jgi:uncharacterized protein (TIGR01777 family)